MMSHDHADDEQWNTCAVATTMTCLKTRLKAGTAAALPLVLRDTPYRLIEKEVTSCYFAVQLALWTDLQSLVKFLAN